MARKFKYNGIEHEESLGWIFMEWTSAIMTLPLRDGQALTL
ncbi:hypothetical protein [Winogradskyella sp.]